MAVLGWWAVSYERGTPVHAEGGELDTEEAPHGRSGQAFERRGHTLKRFKGFYLNAKTGIWP